ncbi:calmodulin-like [Argopecten irradians]|uniref:calmodulin-like n=1 Tax=Argopecten irradians TaxID=31199 RepID=UPI00371A820E
MSAPPGKVDDNDDARLREAFRMFDPEDNGTVRPERLEALMQVLGLNPTKEEVNDLLKDMDIDGDGMLNFNDFSIRMKTVMADTDVEAELRTAFKVFDKDESGKISFEELKSALTSIGEKLTDDEVKEMLREADSNGDGEIDFQEFVTMMSQGQVT